MRTTVYWGYDIEMWTYDALNLRMDTIRRASHRNGKLYIAIQNILESTGFDGRDGCVLGVMESVKETIEVTARLTSLLSKTQ